MIHNKPTVCETCFLNSSFWSLSKPNKKILEPEPEPEQVQGSGLQKDVFGPSHFFQKEENQFWKKHEKNKKLVSVQKWGFERSGEGSYGIQSQEGQELTDVAAAAPLTTQKSSESQIVDVTNKSMVNRYLRVFHPVLHFMVYNRTSCWTCMTE